MLRSVLLLAAVLIPSAALADKIVNPDGDSFIEVETAAQSTGLTIAGIIEALSPIGSAQADSAPAAPVDVPLMREDGDGVDALLKPDYTAESFR